MKQSALLEGLCRESDDSVREQVSAWDQSDIALRVLQEIRRGVGLLPDTWQGKISQIGSLFRSFESNRVDVSRFNKPFDAHLMKLMRLCERAGVPIDETPSRALFQHAALRIERVMIETVGSTSRSTWLDRWRGRPGNPFPGGSIEDAVRYVMMPLFEQAEAALDRLSSADRRRAAEAIVSAFERLDADDQARIRRDLKLDEITADALLRSKAVAALGVATWAGVTIGGFGSYTLLTTLMGTIAGVFGVTLPFGAYIFATSLLAFMSNPLVLAALAGGGGYFFRSKINKIVLDRYLTILVSFSVVSQDQVSKHTATLDSFISHAKRRYTEFLIASPSDRSSYALAFPAFRKP